MLPLLRINDLSIDFVSESGTTSALKNISLSVNRSEILAIVGESGSGKSVTALSILKLLANTAKFTSGGIIFSEDGKNEIDLLRLSNKELQKVRGNRIAMIFQEPMTSLNPVFTCGNQVAESIQLHKKISTGEAKRQAIEWFRKVKLPGPEKVFSKYPHQLSGGQKQRVMIAMAICCKPSLLICDEPTTALDVTVQKNILQLIKELQEEQKMGVIFITHDLGVVSEIADKIAVMYKGNIVETNSRKEIFTNPQHPYTKGLLACRPVFHKKGERLPVVSDFLEAGDNRLQTIVKSVKLDTASVIRDQPSTLLLSVKNLSVWFPVKKNLFGRSLSFTKAVDDVSFEVIKGETLGLVGESGCGKTTLGRTLLRLIEPTAGEIIYNGIDLTKKTSDEIISLRKDIQLVFQDPYSSLNPRLTIGSAISEPLKVYGQYKNEKQRKEKVVDLLEKVNLDSKHFHRYPHEFSGGQRQRIVIARALALDPSFIICDEPVSALDVSVQAQVLNLLNDIKKEFGFTTIFISHDLAVVRYISDRIMVMHKGKIVEQGNADEVYYHPKNEYTKNLIDSIPGKNLNYSR
ncbi:MAG TPA: ABC transporter ATP-binding protein [Chitinophagaceae bacterium]|nr:ABC transporter ATP-binding protein [Chitinophagaceae bacterium]